LCLSTRSYFLSFPRPLLLHTPPFRFFPQKEIRTHGPPPLRFVHRPLECERDEPSGVPPPLGFFFVLCVAPSPLVFPFSFISGDVPGASRSQLLVLGKDRSVLPLSFFGARLRLLLSPLPTAICWLSSLGEAFLSHFSPAGSILLSVFLAFPPNLTPFALRLFYL